MVISLETDTAEPNYEFDAPDLWPDQTPPGFLPPYDAQVFAPDRLSLKFCVYWWEPPKLERDQVLWLYAPFFIVRPLIDEEQSLFRLYRDLLLRRQHNWDRMTELRVRPDGRLGPYPTDEGTQARVRELNEVDAAIDTEIKEAKKRLCNTYWLQRLSVTPALLRNAGEPHALKHYLLYKNELWSSMHGFTDCEWASIAKCQAKLNYDHPLELEYFLELGNGNLDLGRNNAREPIPEDVRFAVWRRDQGRCAKCSSRDRLEFDHIIPVSRGGSSTARNIELLCESCNRRKGANL